MAKIIVTGDHAGPGAAPVFLEESVHLVHLGTDHAARQFVERVRWALGDADAAARSSRARASRARRHGRAPRASDVRAA